MSYSFSAASMFNVDNAFQALTREPYDRAPSDSSPGASPPGCTLAAEGVDTVPYGDNQVGDIEDGEHSRNEEVSLNYLVAHTVDVLVSPKTALATSSPARNIVQPRKTPGQNKENVNAPPASPVRRARRKPVPIPSPTPKRPALAPVDLNVSSATPPRQAGVASFQEVPVELSPRVPAFQLSAFGRPEESFKAHPAPAIRRKPAPVIFLPEAPTPVASAPSPRPPVSILDFNLHSVLGEGGQGKVFLATLKSSSSARPYAVKVISKVNIGAIVWPVLQEQQVLRDLGGADGHPNIMGLEASFHDERWFYLVNEVYPGGDMDNIVTKHGAIPDEYAKFYAAEMAMGIQHLHDYGIIHRDLKLANVLIKHDGHIVIGDFGLVRIFQDGNNGLEDAAVAADQHLTMSWCGTLTHMAPEVHAHEAYSYEVDWWALGVMTYHMLSGFLPWWGDSVDVLVKKILEQDPEFPHPLSNEPLSPESISIMKALLEKNPMRRLTPSGIFTHEWFFDALIEPPLIPDGLSADFNTKRLSPCDRFQPGRNYPPSCDPYPVYSFIGSALRDSMAVEERNEEIASADVEVTATLTSTLSLEEFGGQPVCGNAGPARKKLSLGAFNRLFIGSHDRPPSVPSLEEFDRKIVPDGVPMLAAALSLDEFGSQTTATQEKSQAYPPLRLPGTDLPEVGDPNVDLHNLACGQLSDGFVAHIPINEPEPSPVPYSPTLDLRPSPQSNACAVQTPLPSDVNLLPPRELVCQTFGDAAQSIITTDKSKVHPSLCLSWTNHPEVVDPELELDNLACCQLSDGFVVFFLVVEPEPSAHLPRPPTRVLCPSPQANVRATDIPLPSDIDLLSPQEFGGQTFGDAAQSITTTDKSKVHPSVCLSWTDHPEVVDPELELDNLACCQLSDGFVVFFLVVEPEPSARLPRPPTRVLRPSPQANVSVAEIPLPSDIDLLSPQEFVGQTFGDAAQSITTTDKSKVHPSVCLSWTDHPEVVDPELELDNLACCQLSDGFVVFFLVVEPEPSARLPRPPTRVLHPSLQACISACHVPLPQSPTRALCPSPQSSAGTAHVPLSDLLTFDMCPSPQSNVPTAHTTPLDSLTRALCPFPQSSVGAAHLPAPSGRHSIVCRSSLVSPSETLGISVSPTVGTSPSFTTTACPSMLFGPSDPAFDRLFAADGATDGGSGLDPENTGTEPVPAPPAALLEAPLDLPPSVPSVVLTQLIPEHPPNSPAPGSDCTERVAQFFVNLKDSFRCFGTCWAVQDDIPI